MHNPLDQFAIKVLVPIQVWGLDVSFSNASLTMLIIMALLFVFLGFGSKYNNNPVPNKLQAAAEILYDMIENMVEGTAGPKARSYIPFIFTLFMFILLSNLWGMIPYSFTVTSHIAVTFTIAAFVFIGVTMLGFIKHGLHYLSLLLPAGMPKIMAPFLLVIELLAYLIRPVSLSTRLAANMIAGHVMLKVLASLIIMSGVFGIFPLTLLTLITGFEIFIAVLQAYVFSVLTCVYLNDALNLH